MSHSRWAGSGSSGAKARSATGISVTAHNFANRITFGCLVAFMAMTACPAGELAVSVVDSSGHGVTDVVVTVAKAESRTPMPTPTTAATPATMSASATAVMDQRNLAFEPRVLVVGVGTSVEFPNNDTVSHQVYSFSQPKKFQLPLYKGERHSPVLFDKTGLVVLGCNIHDGMIGYIYVTDAPYFGKTDSSGALRLRDLSAGEYRMTVWSPFVVDLPSTLTSMVHVDAQEVTAARVQMQHNLRARPEPRPRHGDWEY